MKALRRFTVRAALPEALKPLEELVLNLRWSWHQDTKDLFASVDPETWEKVGHDPQRLLAAVSPARMAQLAVDRRFLRRLEDLSDDLHDYMSGDRWYQGLVGAPSAIAYFSPEFGLTGVLPQYSGGLGILAGDHLKAASDLGVPIIGVGLLYRRGYFTQSLSSEGWQLERYPALDPAGLPITLLRDSDGGPLTVRIDVPTTGMIAAHVWLVQAGRVPLLMLDSDIEENSTGSREVTDRLYGGSSEHRLAQEILLGVGGVRAVRAYCALTGHPVPEVFHTNEGHAGFLGLERIREHVELGMTFDSALEATRAGTVFTTHTPVPAGIDRFSRTLIEQYFGGNKVVPGVPLDRILTLGAEPGGDGSVFNMAYMGLRLGARANGVSILHGEVSREMFEGLWPGFDPADIPITSVTNGVHDGTWLAPETVEMIGRVSPDMSMPLDFDRVHKVPDAAIWQTRRALRERLVQEVRSRLRVSCLQRGMSESGLDWVDSVFDPDVLTIGFARRVPSYKRLTLMLEDPERFKALLLDPDRPIQIVVAGKAHPADDGGKAMIQQLVRFADDPEVRHRITFLPDYDIKMARVLVAGSDVWLNNPLRPLEACGTSGMKAALNGVLNLSIRDGWWDEMFDGQNGWAIPSADHVPPERRDATEAASLYDLLENQVRTRFYDYDPRNGGLPTRWIEMVRHCFASLGPKVLASRMLEDYVNQLYTPAALASRRMSADDHVAASTLAEWKHRVRAGWKDVVVEHTESLGDSDLLEVGGAVRVRAQVRPDHLSPEDLDVQVCYGPVDDDDQLQTIASQSMVLVHTAADGLLEYEGGIDLDWPGSFGYTVRVLPRHPLLASSAELGLVALPKMSEVEDTPAGHLAG